jgi:hypothetical protein
MVDSKPPDARPRDTSHSCHRMLGRHSVAPGPSVVTRHIRDLCRAEAVRRGHAPGDGKSRLGTRSASGRAALDATTPPGFWGTFESLREGNAEGLDLAVTFLENDPWFFRSGYLKQDPSSFVAASGYEDAGHVHRQSECD